MDKSMEQFVAFLKHYGFVYQGSEIYGGLANTWDFGPLGVELKNNIKQFWWKKFVQERPDVVGLDSSILLNTKIWEASGHIDSFSDPLVDCKSCGVRFRADNLIEDHSKGKIIADGWTNEDLKSYLVDNNVKCPKCDSSNFTDVRKFNLMFKTNQGVIEDDEQTTIYLRPETCQGIFVNFKNVQRTSRKKVPFGIAQVGKSFRNEITPGNFIFRTREFEQMEMEFFCKPETSVDWFVYWKKFCLDFLLDMGINKEKIRYRDHSEDELSFYSKATTDIEFLYFFGWGELWGIANRTDYDLKTHQTHSGESLEYFDPETNTKYIPHVVEPSVGVERLLLAVLTDAYENEKLEDCETREVLHLHPKLAPIKAAVFPLTNKLKKEAEAVYKKLMPHFMCEYDTSGNIGKRYRRYDAIGTPFCITYDFDSLDDNCVTIRERDSMQQERVKIDDVVDYIKNKI